MDEDEKLESRRQELVRIIQSFEKLEMSEEWGTVKELLLGRSLESLNRQLLSEAREANVDLPSLYRLQGKIEWARRYCDQGALVRSLKAELEAINKKIR